MKRPRLLWISAMGMLMNAAVFAYGCFNVFFFIALMNATEKGPNWYLDLHWPTKLLALISVVILGVCIASAPGLLTGGKWWRRIAISIQALACMFIAVNFSLGAGSLSQVGIIGVNILSLAVLVVVPSVNDYFDSIAAKPRQDALS